MQRKVKQHKQREPMAYRMHPSFTPIVAITAVLSMAFITFPGIYSSPQLSSLICGSNLGISWMLNLLVFDTNDRIYPHLCDFYMHSLILRPKLVYLPHSADSANRKKNHLLLLNTKMSIKEEKVQKTFR